MGEGGGVNSIQYGPASEPPRLIKFQMVLERIRGIGAIFILACEKDIHK